VDLHHAPDAAIWSYAREHDFTIVSKDADFSEISLELGYPPKLVWLQIENVSTDEVEHLIRAKYAQIMALPAATDRAILVLFRRRSD